VSEAICPLDAPISVAAEEVSAGPFVLLVEKLLRPVTIPHPAATIVRHTTAITDERFQPNFAFPL